MKRLLVLGVLLAAAWSAAPAGAKTNECRGLPVCVPVVGPWVVVPAKLSVPRPQVQYQLSCPKGYIAGGTDAELSSRAIDVSFFGSLGAPVNPGVTTARDVVFVGTYVGTAKVLPSFRPHLGCMPANGGGQRTPTAVIFPVGKPVVRHVANLVLHPGRQRVTAACAPSERLVDVQTAVGMRMALPPQDLLPIEIVPTISGRRVAAKVTSVWVPAGATGVVQLMAVCAGGS